MSIKNDIVYLDTSVVIALFVHPSEIKKHIRIEIAKYKFRLTGLVVQQEFCRRLLKEAKYLLGQLEKRRSFNRVLSHLVDLSKFHDRKFRICLQTMINNFPDGTDADRTERLQLFLEDLLENGIAEIKQNIVDEIVKSVGCASAIEGIHRTKSGFRFPHDECSKHERCGVGDFLNESPDREPLLQFLIDNDERLTAELKKGKESLLSLRELGCVNACKLDPCISIGDVLISLESRSAGVFLTQNFKESNLLCEQSGQTINVCLTNQDKLP